MVRKERLDNVKRTELSGLKNILGLRSVTEGGG